MTNEKFQLLIGQYEKLVFTICYQLIRDYHEAQNLAQDTFLSAYMHIDGCKEENYRPYLARIAANKAKDYLKSAYARRVTLTGDDEDSPAADNSSPENTYMVHEGEKAIKDKIYSLKEPYREVSVLYFIEEKNVDEIALLTGTPKKTVQTRLYRAKLQLQKKLRKEEKRYV